MEESGRETLNVMDEASRMILESEISSREEDHPSNDDAFQDIIMPEATFTRKQNGRDHITFSNEIAMIESPDWLDIL